MRMQSPFWLWGNWLNVKVWDLNVNVTSTYRRKGERETERERWKERWKERKKNMCLVTSLKFLD